MQARFEGIKSERKMGVLVTPYVPKTDILSHKINTIHTNIILALTASAYL